MSWIRRGPEGLTAEDVPLARIADAVGTPAYVYGAAAVRERYARLQAAMEPYGGFVAFAVKSNGCPALLAMLAELGSGFDIVSIGELRRVRRAGGDPGRTVFSGVGKTAAEIREALEAGVLMLNVESVEELESVDEQAQALGRRAPVALRVNPAVDPETHPHVATGLATSKFGIDVDAAAGAYALAARLPGIEVVGVACHIGSQILSLEPYAAAMRSLGGLVRELQAAGLRLRLVDVGGGLGLPYEGGPAPSVEAWVTTLTSSLAESGVRLSPDGCRPVIEPGRSIVGPAGLLLATVLYRKEQRGKRFAVVDAAMNDFIRPALYGQQSRIAPVTPRPGDPRPVDVVGPVCECGDFLARDVHLPPLERGDRIAVLDTGAYGRSMASNYNDRPRPPEVLVDGASFRVVTPRESYDEVLSR